MASNFRILFYENSGSLYIKLNGDFDGSSAYELINALKEHGRQFYTILIDTDDLKTIHPFGRAVFEKNFKTFRKEFKHIVFAGENRNHIAPNLSLLETL